MKHFFYSRRLSRRAIVVAGGGAVGALAAGAWARAAASQKPRTSGKASSPRQRSSFNADWRFHQGDPDGAAGLLDYAKIKDWVNATGDDLVTPAARQQTRPEGNPGANVAFVQSDFDDNGWRHLDLPHDWGIEGPFHQEYPGETGKLPWWGVGWYRKRFVLPEADKGKQIYLDMDGAMSYAAVWLNGEFVGGWPYGYASFRLDLTPHIKPGADNVLAIRLDNPPDSSRWYPGGGIYRNVWLVKTAPVHVDHGGTFVTTPEIRKDAATVNVSTTLVNKSTTEARVTVRTQLYQIGANGRRAGGIVAEAVGAEVRLAPGEHATVPVTRLSVRNPKLWGTKTPHRYAVLTIVAQDDKIVDRSETLFGIRAIQFDATKGFLLNGVRVPLNGVCNHHDLGALGAALHVRALERQIELLQEMGCNAIRTSHNPPAPELLDLCDKRGVLVIDEFSDTWKNAKKPNGYAVLFDDWHEKDVRAFVRRDRNHPCVIAWSTGNEVGEQWSPDGQKISSALTAIVHGEDPTRPATAGCNNTDAGFNGFQKTLDVFGYNYKPHEYGRFHERNPGIPLYGSETASTVSSRGEYFFPVSNDKNEGRADFQVSSYDLYAPPWATTPDTEFAGQDAFPFSAGEFVWTGFDYLGEPTPYNADTTNLLNFSDPAEKARLAKELEALGKIRVPSRSSYFGILDLCGFKKDRFYLYQARWRPDHPVAHILPHWTWPERVGQVTPIHVYTSGDEAELFLNNRSLGRKKRGPHEYRLRWDDVVYEPGEVRVVAYKKGKRWAENVVKTAGTSAKIALTADRTTLQADGRDLSYVTVALLDEQGTLVPRAKNRVQFAVSGPGEIVATDNGDATNLESFQAKERNAFNGLCLVIVRSKAGAAGAITLRAESNGLQGGSISLRAVPEA